MALRWFVCPIVEVTPTDPETGQATAEPVRLPKLATLTNPATGRGYATWEAAAHLANWAVVLVRAIDFAPILADSQCVDLLEQSYEDADAILLLTPAQLGWNNAKLNRVRNRLSQRGVDVSGLDAATPLVVWLARLTGAIDGSFNPLKMKAR